MYASLKQIKSRNKAAGRHWFSPDTMRFFKTILYPAIYGGCLFISSEKGPSGFRMFTVRRANADGSIVSVSDFQQFGTLYAAKKWTQALVKNF